MKIHIGLVDDHQLFLKSLGMMLESFGNYEVVLEATNGADLQQKMEHQKIIPDIMLIDVNMPVMDGPETAAWLNKNYPSVRLIALTMNDKDHSVIKMFRAGCSAYLLKDIHPSSLECALKEVIDHGFYNGDISNITFRKLMLKSDDRKEPKITTREMEFLQLACSEMTYKQVAAEMNLSERTIDGYRESLFEKMHVQSRVGMCLEALRREYVKL
jgi:DNA-binding NarL/FixJ family response regulator